MSERGAPSQNVPSQEQQERHHKAESHLDEVGRDMPTQPEGTAVKTEAIANYRIEDSEIGSAFLDRIDTLTQTETENAPLGAWEKLKYAVGGGGERAQKYKEARKDAKALERDREILVKKEQKFREEARVLCQEVQEAMAIIEDPEASAKEVRKAHKKIFKTTIKSVKDRRFIDEGILADVKKKIGYEEKETEAEKTTRLPAIREVSHDYREKGEEIESLARHLQTSDGFIGLLQKISTFGGQELEEDMDKFLTGKGSRPLRALAESQVRSRLLQEKVEQITNLRDTERWAKFNPNDLFVLLSEVMRSKKEEKAYEREVAREYKGAIRTHQMKKYGKMATQAAGQVVKRGLAKAVGSNEEVEEDTTVRQIIESGDNLIAQTLIAARKVPEFVSVSEAQTRDKTMFAESTVLSGFEFLLRRNIRLEKWRISVDERRGRSSEKIREKSEVIKSLKDALMAISKRKKEKSDAKINIDLRRNTGE